MKKCKHTAIGAAVLFSFITLFFSTFSCSKQQAVVFFSDPYTTRLYFDEKSEKNALKKTAEKYSRRLHINSIDPFGTKEVKTTISTHLERNDAGRVICTPLTAAAASGLESHYPDVTFYFIDYTPFEEKKAPAPGKNVHIIEISRGKSYREAGEIFGSYVEREAEKKRVGALFYTGTPERERERSAFYEGFTRHSSPEYLYIREIEDLSRSGEAIQFIDEMATRDIRFLFLSLSALNTVCFDHIRSKDILVATEDIVPAEAFEERILFSIEYDYKKVVEIAVKTDRKEETRLLTVDSVIRKGGAREVKSFFAGTSEEKNNFFQ